jgi:L-malate glycosyltransferase
MKICAIPSTFLPIVGGAEIQCHNFCNYLTKKKLTVDVWCLKKHIIPNKKYKQKFFNMFYLNIIYLFEYYLNLNMGFFLRIYLKKINKEFKYDVYHFHSMNYKLLLILRELKNLNKKVIVTFQGADIQIKKEINYGYRLKKKYDLLLKKLIKKIDIIHAISNNIENDLKRLGIKKRRIVKIPNTVFIKKIEKYKSKSNKKNHLKLLTVARFAEKKKGFDFIETLGNQLKNKVKFKWTVIGRDSHKIYQYKFVKDNPNFFEAIPEIKNKNEFFFPPSSLIRHYKQTDIYIHLSRIESFGISMIEAMCANLPILAIDSKGSNELLKNNINGYFFSLQNNNFLKKIKLIKKKKLNLNKLKKYNKKYVINFDLEGSTNKLVDVYKNI